MIIFIVLFISTFLIAIIELILDVIWAKWYFRYGIPLFRRIGIIKSDIILPMDAEHIQTHIADSTYTPFLVKDIGDNCFAFREKLFNLSKASYTPLMHGFLVIDPVKREMKIIGHINIYPIFFSLTILSIMLLILFTSKWFSIIPAIFLLSFFVFLGRSIYNIQSKRYNRIYSSFTDSTFSAT